MNDGFENIVTGRGGCPVDWFVQETIDSARF